MGDGREEFHVVLSGMQTLLAMHAQWEAEGDSDTHPRHPLHLDVREGGRSRGYHTVVVAKHGSSHVVAQLLVHIARTFWPQNSV